MAQFATVKNPPWARGSGAGPNPLGQPPPPGTSLANTLLAAQATNAAGAAAGQIATAGVSAGTLATAAAVVAAAQSQGQAAPAVSAAYGTSLAAMTLTQSALQQGAVLQQSTLGIPASLAATTQVNNGVVVELARLPQPGVALPTSLASTQVATVSYPAPRLLPQTGQFQASQTNVVQQAAVAQVQTQQQQPPTLKQRVFTGSVTKLHENFGVVDEDVFFQMNVVKGNLPKAGERVLVEASYNPNMPFKWNATRIQVLPNQPNQISIPQSPNNQRIAQAATINATVMTSGVSSVLPIQGVGVTVTNQPQFANISQPSRWQVQQEIAVIEQIGPQRMSIPYDGRLEGPHPWVQDIDYQEIMDNKGPRIRRHSPPLPSRREREREREMRRDDRRERERYRERYSPPPPRKRSRSPRRPSRSPPRRRPRIVPRYTVQVPKISLDFKEGNLIELRKRYTNLYIPSDFCSASFLWQDAFPPHQPFSLDHPCTFQIVGKDFEPVYELEGLPEATDTDHLYSAKVMLLASPSLKEIFRKSCALAEDNEDAKENFVHPTRLVSFLVGLKGKNETVAIGGPWSPSLDGLHPDKDPSVLIKTAIRTCKSLTGIDLSKCSQWYRFAEIHYRRGETTHKGRVVPTRVETVILFLPDVWSCLPTRVEWDNLVSGYKNQLLKKLHEEPAEVATTEIQDEDTVELENEQLEPTHFSELDPKTLKVTDLKRELEARNLSVKGLKSQLISRLTKAIKLESEKVEESIEVDGNDNDEKLEMDESAISEEKKKEEMDLKSKEEHYEKKCQLPETPCIIVQPSRKAKGGKFDCTIMSLSLLLDYRQEDNKEHSFEVSLFAELFNEMMMRDFGFRIYRSLVEMPDAKDDERDKKRSDRKDESKHKKDEKEDHRRKDDGGNESDRDEDDTDDDDNDGDDRKDRDRKRKRKKKPQMVTHDPFLLLSYVYYDQTHCGYLLDKDLEEILYTLGLQLSRAQVRKIVQKACERETLRYRKLTDRPIGDTNKHNEVSKVNIEDLALGNKKYLLNSSHQDIAKCENNISVVTFQGAIVDVGKLLKQLERSEKARVEIEQKLKDLEHELDGVSKLASLKEKQSQKLSQDLEEQKIKYLNSEDELKKTVSQNEKFVKALQTCKDQMIIATNTVDNVLKGRSSRSSLTRGNGSRKSFDSDNYKSRDAEKDSYKQMNCKIKIENNDDNSQDRSVDSK